MTTPVRTPQQQDSGDDRSDPNANGSRHAPELESTEEPLGEQLIREAREGQDEFVAGWGKFMHELGIEGQPIGAKNLRELLVAEGINPKLNEFSQGIIAMREE